MQAIDHNIRNLVVAYGAIVGYPFMSGFVNGGLKYGLGNHTEYQFPETVDDLAAEAIMVGVTKTSWTFQVFTFLMMCGSIVSLLRALVDLLYLLHMIAPYIGAVVNCLACFFMQVWRRLCGGDENVLIDRRPVPVRALAGRAVRRRAVP